MHRPSRECPQTFNTARRAAPGAGISRRSGPLVQPVQDARALDQHFTVIEHQRRHPPQRDLLDELFRIAERRPRPVIVGEPVNPQRHRNPPHERRVIPPDQNHRFPGIHRDHPMLAAHHRFAKLPTNRPLPPAAAAPQSGRPRSSVSRPTDGEVDPIAAAHVSGADRTKRTHAPACPDVHRLDDIN